MTPAPTAAPTTAGSGDIIAAWSVDADLPALRIVQQRGDYVQFRARAGRGQLELALHRLSDGRLTVEMTGTDPMVSLALAGLLRIKDAIR